MKWDPKNHGKPRRRSSGMGQRSFVELFAGIGLVRLAFERVGWKCVFANDIDPKKKATYEANFASDDFHLGDIWDLDPMHLPRANLITASFPCVDLSLAGNREGLGGKHSGTFWALIRLLTAMKQCNRQPEAVLIENVVGFLTSNNGKDLLSAVTALNQCGYVVDALVLDARHFTAQSRPRLFLVALAEGIAGQRMTRPDEKLFSRWTAVLDDDLSLIRPPQLRQLIRVNSHLGWGLLALPSLPTRQQVLSDIVETLPEDSKRWWSEEQVQKLIGQMWERHRFAVNELIHRATYSFGTIYRRKRPGGTRAELRLDGIAGCLRTPRGGSSKQIIVRAGKGVLRARWMTPREYARLQGVPDSYRLPANDIDAYFGFGDAVCVPAVEWLARFAIDPAFDTKAQSRRS